MKLKTLRPQLATVPGTLPTINPGSWRTDGMTSAQRGYGYRWQKARAAYLDKHPLCVFCELDGRAVPATVVDHKIPHRGDQTLFWDQTNWQSLCATHHSSDKQRQEAASA